MSKIDFFKTNLAVFFTLEELYQISSALATESFSQADQNNHFNSEYVWKLRKKVGQFIDSYKHSSSL